MLKARGFSVVIKQDRGTERSSLAQLFKRVWHGDGGVRRQGPWQPWAPTSRAPDGSRSMPQLLLPPSALRTYDSSMRTPSSCTSAQPRSRSNPLHPSFRSRGPQSAGTHRRMDRWMEEWRDRCLRRQTAAWAAPQRQLEMLAPERQPICCQALMAERC
ncbi:hypothetical protein SRHO_G00128120 [Serrasalmus rhombeus]